MNNQTIYWLWIQNVLGYASSKITLLMNKYTFAEDFYRASFEEKLLCGCFSDKHYEKLKNTSLVSCSRIIEFCKKNAIDIITPGDAVYPNRLKKIKAPPAALFVKGDTDCLSSKICIAVIGTRRATAAGCAAAMNVTKELCHNGAVIISGGAKGIDTAAHTAAIANNGKTVCVLGHGHARCSYNKNAQLILNNMQNGAVISEYVPFESPSKNTYPLRDRLISGLSDGVAVIESGETGGTMITVKAAESQKRDLFAYRFPDKNNISKGTAMLISKGVVPVSSGNDIIRFYNNADNTALNDSTASFIKEKETYFKSVIKSINRGYSVDLSVGEKHKKTPEEQLEAFFKAHPIVKREYVTLGRTLKNSSKANEYDTRQNDNRKQNIIINNSQTANSKAIVNDLPKTENKPLPEDLSSEAVKIYEILSDTPLSVDKIVELTGLNIRCVNSALTELELDDLAQGVEGRRYSKK